MRTRPARAVLRPGNPTGTLVIRATGGFEQTASGELVVGIGAGGNGFLRLDRTAATLGGTLTIELLDGFSPAVGQSFFVLDYSSRSGEFDRVNLPEPGPGWKLEALYEATGVTVRVVPRNPTPPGLAAGSRLPPISAAVEHATPASHATPRGSSSRRKTPQHRFGFPYSRYPAPLRRALRACSLNGICSSLPQSAPRHHARRSSPHRQTRQTLGLPMTAPRSGLRRRHEDLRKAPSRSTVPSWIHVGPSCPRREMQSGIQNP